MKRMKPRPEVTPTFADDKMLDVKRVTFVDDVSDPERFPAIEMDYDDCPKS